MNPRKSRLKSRDQYKILRGLSIMRRVDDSLWSNVLTPVLQDTRGVTLNLRNLQNLDHLTRALLNEYTRYPAPRRFIHLGPDELAKVDALAFASFIVAHRTERLAQAIDLGAVALDCLEHGSLLPGAAAARALLEITFVSSSVHDEVLAAWREVHGDRDAKLAIACSDSAIWRSLWTARLGTRLYDEEVGGEKWPRAKNVLTRRDHYGSGSPDFAEQVNYEYALLCETVHPNVESQGVFWRVAEPLRDGRRCLAFEPAASESPVKLAIVNAVALALASIVPYCRDLWWIASEVACSKPFNRSEEVVSLGLPFQAGTHVPCCCGSGTRAADCLHPEPEPTIYQVVN